MCRRHDFSFAGDEAAKNRNDSTFLSLGVKNLTRKKFFLALPASRVSVGLTGQKFH